MRRAKITKIYNKKRGTIPTKCTAPLSLFIVLAKRLKSLPALFYSSCFVYFQSV